jgi:dipeptidyl aminopeptidase/acylaminoacyl peptidase
VGQPQWAGDGHLRYVSDRAGWWQPYEVEIGDASKAIPPVRLTGAAAEFHGPDWVLGISTMAELTDGTLVSRMTSDGRDALVALHPGRPGDTEARPDELSQPCVGIEGICAHGDGVAFIGTTPDTAATVWLWSPGRGARALRPPSNTGLEHGSVSAGEAFTVTGRSGRLVHGTVYRPVLAGTAGPEGAAPPLVVWCHGGPTSASRPGLDPVLQFFTTRGFAVACVDYAGSSGYGRAYRRALSGLWGVADAEDCADAALQLAARGQADPARLAIRGGSAGGMTALNALGAGEGFGACASWYGVTDLLALAATTHDFEAHYTDDLIGPLPQSRGLYEERSPVNRAAAMAGSVLLLQGSDDAVVPPSQAERMRDALAEAGTRCDLRFFEGEAHGFRRADTLTACLEAEWAFYLQELDL